jgi:hypothetical protein
MKFIAHISILIYSLSINACHSDDDREVIYLSVLFNLSEKNTQKEIKDFVYYADIEFKFLLGHYNKSSLILSENLSKHDKISGSIFSLHPI